LSFFLFLSFGRTLPIIYNLFFDYVPFFSSFQGSCDDTLLYWNLAFVVLAGFGLKSIYEDFKDDASKEKLKKISLVLGSIAGLMLLISFLVLKTHNKFCCKQSLAG